VYQCIRKVTLVGCMRKLLIILNAMVKNRKEPYPLEVSLDPGPLTLETVASSCPYSPECVEG